MNILLLGCGGNAGINFVKSLKKYSSRSYTVYGIDMNPYYLTASNADIKISQPKFNNEYEKINFLEKIIDENKINFIHAQPDPEVEFLLRNKKYFSNVLFDHQYDIWQNFSNKLYCQKIWKEKLNLNVQIESFFDICNNPQRFKEIVDVSGKAWIRYSEGAGSKAALPVTTLEQAKSWVSYWKECRNLNEDKFMVAEYLPNEEYAVQTIWKQGQLIQIQARKRLIYFFGALMPSGQTSTPAVAVTVNDKNHPVYNVAKKAILSIHPNPHGIYCVDLKENVNKNIIPMEVNYGRFFTTSDFFASIGRNMPEEYIKIFNKENVIYTEPLEETKYWIRGLDKEPVLS